MKFEGSYTALVTPFAADGGIDEAALRGMIRRQIRSGTAGLVPCGSTGEASALTHGEYLEVLRVCVEEAGGRIPVIAGLSGNATAKVADLAREAASSGVDAVMAAAPYYVKPTQDGIFEHFKAVAGSVKIPVMVYNIPGRTAVNILPQTIVRMAREIPNISAVKEAAGSLDQVSEILALAPKSLTVLSGDDSLALPMMAVGARGVVSVASNVLPREISRLCTLALKGRSKEAGALHLKLFPVIKALFVETNPIPVKAACEMMGLCRGELRLPLRPLPAALRPGLRRSLKTWM